MDREKKKIIFIGDSITHAGRNELAEPSWEGALGYGFANLINAELVGRFPQKEIFVLNKGIGGNRIIDLKKRWNQDVIEERPDILTIMIGVNDAWRQVDGRFLDIEQISFELFEAIYIELIEQTLTKVPNIIIMSAFMLETNPNDEFRQLVDHYNEIAQKIAENYHLPYINVQKKFDEFLKYQSSYRISSDRVHPNIIGHQIIAKEWLSQTEIF